MASRSVAIAGSISVRRDSWPSCATAMTLAEALKSPSLRRIWPWIWSSFPVLLLLHYQAVAPVGHWSLLNLQFPYLVAVPVAACAVVVLPLLLLRRATRMLVLAWLIAALVYLLLTCGGVVIGHRIRHWGFDQLALRSAPLVSAIRAYADAHGQPPSSLADLVPAYLPRVPGTGVMAYPDYRYSVGAQAQEYDQNPWVLVIPTTSGGINFDQFMYFPLQNYPARGYGGMLAPIRDWAYVHE